MLARLAGGTGPKQVADCYKGLIDALVVDEADADEDAGRAARSSRRTLMSDADAQAPARRGGARDRGDAAMKIAIIGGTGSLRPRARCEAARCSARTSTSARATRERAEERALEIGVERRQQRGRRPGRRPGRAGHQVERRARDRARARRRDRRHAGALRRERPSLHRHRHRRPASRKARSPRTSPS